MSRDPYTLPGYDAWKTRSDLDDASRWRSDEDEKVSQCESCGEMKADCVYTTTGGRFPMGVHACPQCRGEDK